ncbi:MAG TPA: BolA/IbaG family iron-sulfur metabolism protein [Oligoflexus sp.]|uniref:BolA/IbaG family iron-sulfur metabolism protein n=1 Tax=Oligoflexus sp. TaxID=1971216 RepID=UPI002D80F0F5|nr:BolA/IbaG family iron-sulfur metabolism protein [Oligoflexus sp.]HET9240976.1 BolA/IbaG family iron-sulfur metabolism protein [Oligoflexus sp.]
MKAEDIISRIQQSIPSAQIKAYDMTGGGDHWQLTIQAKEFNGLNLVEQHQLVYKALGEWMHGPIHALSLNTRAAD